VTLATGGARGECGAQSLIDIDSTFLPVGEMRQISRVTDLSLTVIAGEVDIGPDHWVYAGHLPGDPIFPGTLMIEAAGQLVALWAWAQGKRGRPRLVRITADFRHPVGPKCSRLQLQADMRSKRNIFIANVRILADDIQVATVEAMLAVLPAV
jgi:3-hydroxymyristoyl/3-hydroxydecanoyl-(acyl carrier protein) dehydratase